MSLKSKFKSSVARVSEGVWFDVVRNSDKTLCRVKLRRHGRSNARWAAAFRDRTAGIDADSLTPEEDAELMANVFLDAVLVDWEHMQPDDDGHDLPYTLDNARELLLDPEWNDLLRDFQAKSQQLTPFQEKQEAEAGN